MIKGENFIGRSPSKDGEQSLYATNPVSRMRFDEEFAVATPDDIKRAAELSNVAFEHLKTLSAKQRALFIETIAEEIMQLGDTLVARACDETGLPKARIEGERARTCHQLQQFASLLHEGSWVNAIIDTAIADRTPIPKPDLRKMQIPIGPVAVFGASNFPLAFSTAGGDTASALAAGNPVIVKGHESHLGTNELVSRAILKAAEKTDMPDGVFSMLNGGIEVGQALVKHPCVKAVGFTGSLKAGNALCKLANEREEPIPVYAEMGSINPVFLLAEKLSANPEALAEHIAASVTQGTGQFCTNPGLIVGIASEAFSSFSKTLKAALQNTPKAAMLSQTILQQYNTKKATLLRAIDSPNTPTHTPHEDNLATAFTANISAQEFMQNPILSEEIFGPFTLQIICESEIEMKHVAQHLQGQLTATLMATENDLHQYSEILSILQTKVGRLLFNGVPTGVEVCRAMQHGGPYPATSNAHHTSVGMDAIYRFTRPISFQNWPDSLLPAALQTANPLAIWRLVNGDMTKETA